MSDASREEEIFAEALARPSAERAAFVGHACAGDVALRASVESLLAAHERPVAFIDQAQVAPPVVSPEEDPRTGSDRGQGHVFTS